MANLSSTPACGLALRRVTCFFMEHRVSQYSDAVVRSAGATTKDYTMGVSYGIGAEMKIGNGWSTRLDLTRTDLGQKNQSFNGLTRDTNVKMDKITIGLTKSF